MAPIQDNTGVPIKRDRANTPRASPDRSNKTPSKGANNTNGKPHKTQCAAIFATTSKVNGVPDNSICSKVPSRWSTSNKRFSASKLASKAPTHSTPGASMRKVARSGPTARGNKAATTTKKNTTVSTSLGRRKASNRSRRNKDHSALMPGPIGGCGCRRWPNAPPGGW